MKRSGNLLYEITDADNLRFAAWKAAKGKRHSTEILKWFENMEEHIAKLRDQILSGQVQVGNYRYFKVYEPKERQICASAFGEQVLHHAVMNICHAQFEKVQIFDSYASRKGKGTYAALERAKVFTRQNDWYLKLDVKKFFESIHHEVLVQQLCRMFKDPAVVGVFEQIIHSYEASPGRGLPIGNLTSQYFANHYLATLDHFIKEKLRIKAYVRYMDDMVCWSADKEGLLEARDHITDFVEKELACKLKPEGLNRTTTGLPFLGYHVFPYHVRLLQKSKQRFIRKMRSIDDHYQSGEWPESKCQRKVLPLLAFTKHSDANQFRQNILSKI